MGHEGKQQKIQQRQPKNKEASGDVKPVEKRTKQTTDRTRKEINPSWQVINLPSQSAYCCCVSKTILNQVSSVVSDQACEYKQISTLFMSNDNLFSSVSVRK